MHGFQILMKTNAMVPTTVLCLAAGVMSVYSADWSGYRGSNNDGVSTEKFNWPAGGPKVVWKAPTKTGFSCFAINGGKVFTQMIRDVDGTPREICLALDAQTGKELWFADVAAGKFDGSGNAGTPDNKGGDGPRSTPTVSDGKVYVFTPDLVLHCLDAANGKQIWRKSLLQDHAGRNIGWNSAASAVVDGDLVFVAGGGAGQSLLGINKNTGEVVWKAHDEKITHATPVVATILGTKQVIFFLQSGLLAVSAKDGKALWRFPFRYNVSTAISPIVSGDIVYCSAGYGVGGGACRITKSGEEFSATELYKVQGDKQIANHWSTPFAKDGYLYGMFSFKDYGKGPMKCVDIATGQVKWTQPGFGAGNAILVGDKIVALSDDGQVVIVEPTPTAYKEIGRFKAIEGKCWTTPAFSDGRIYVRSVTEGACLDVSGK